ncbi:MAG: hypothetical protein R2759_12745 [Bacteroidales bacterium]
MDREKVSKALGITVNDNGTDLQGDKIWIEDRGIKVDNKDIYAGRG